jgi:gliding motility-associated-like protein
MKRSATGQKCTKPFSQFQLTSGTNLSKCCILFMILVLMAAVGFAQAPVISYHTPNVFEQDTAITPLTPNNTGGAVSNTPAIKVADVSQVRFFFNNLNFAVDAGNNIYVCNYSGSNILKFPAAGGSPVPLGSGIPNPSGVAVDAAGNLYVTGGAHDTTRAAQLWKIPVAGGPATVIGTGLTIPQGLALDAAGNIYVANYGSSNIVKFIPGNTAPVIVASMPYPRSIAIDPANNIYAVNGSYLYKIPAGTNAIAPFDRCPETAAQTIACDAAGNIYLSQGYTIANLAAVPVLEGRFVKKIPADGSGIVSEGTDPLTYCFAVAVTPSGTIFTNNDPDLGIYKITQGNYSISPSLPVDLYLEANTGKIGGTPLLPSPPTSYVVTAHNNAGSSSATLSIRVLSTNAFLSDIIPSKGVLDYPVKVGTIFGYLYSSKVNYEVDSITVTPVAMNPAATIKVNGAVVKSNTPSAPIPLVVGQNAITIVVIAQDGITTLTYTFICTRNSPSNNNLSHLALSRGVLSPAFNSLITTYSTTVSNTISSLTVTPTAADTASRITVNGTAVASGTASLAIPLSVGSNVIAIVVNTPGKTANTYTVTATRAPSPNTFLSTLAISRGVLSPKFSHLITSYTTEVASAISSVTVTPTTSNPGAAVTVNGSSVPSGTASTAIPLSVGLNTITVAVTASDGNVNTYTIAVTRAPSPDSFLSGLVLSQGILSPKFSHLTTSYTTRVSPDVAYLTITPTALNPGATITVNGTAVTTGTASGFFLLSEGYNTFTIVVTSPDGFASLTYTITALLLDNSLGDVNLLSLDLDHGVLSPVFSPSVTSYTASVGNEVTSIGITPTTINPISDISVDGGEEINSGIEVPVPLQVGDNVVTIDVENFIDFEPFFMRYTVTINRAGPPPVDAVKEPVSVVQPLETPQLAADGVNVHEGITPNGDGINDFLQIDGILSYPDNKLQILNRSGQLIFEAKNYDNSSKVFDGHSSKTGAMQLPGTYFYTLDYTVKGVAKHKTGFIVLKY